MNTKAHVFFIAILMIMGCQSGIMESDGKSDAEIIEAIRNASKVNISMIEIPSQSKAFIDSDNEYDALSAEKAFGLGYEVDLAGSGSRFGDRKEYYFNLEGRKLDPYDYGKDKDGWYREGDVKEDWKCFDLVLPVTFDMPDGTAIDVTSDDEEGWGEIKAWYESNSGSEERPALQYPVDMIFRDENGEVTITINSDEERRETQVEYCSSDRD